ncbi:polysaccharide deacetylase family protein [Alteromonadaceae bacterium BrNp21-10]|nr:polysaccharide deacetylase family protein [Alteromonadaceae bacterium BrNp21-10]
MKPYKRTLLIIITALLPLSTSLAEDFVNWPNGAKAAVSLSYDDALNSQLDNAIPALNKYHFKGSFYLSVSNAPVYERLEEWRKAAKQGHELGNHTVNHPCRSSLPGREWVKPYANLDNYSLEQIEREIATTNAFLKAIDGETERTFTPPCIDDKVDNGKTSYWPILSKYFIGAKGVPMNLPKEQIELLMPSNVTGQQLIDFVSKAADQGHLASIVFHGIGGDHLMVSTQAHEELLQHLANNPKRYYVDSYVNIMRYAKQQ